MVRPATKFCGAFSAGSQLTVVTNGFRKVEFRADSKIDEYIFLKFRLKIGKKKSFVPDQ